MAIPKLWDYKKSAYFPITTQYVLIYYINFKSKKLEPTKENIGYMPKNNFISYISCLLPRITKLRPKII